MNNPFDFKEMFGPGALLSAVLPELLADRTTGKNIVWATGTYEEHGPRYERDRQIMSDRDPAPLLDGMIVPRILKGKEEQKKRTKRRAEIFTPSWLCNRMINDVEEQVLGRRDLFNTESQDFKTWTTNEKKVKFDKLGAKGWQKYVRFTQLELTCGEGPYLVSRYDTTTGEPIPVKDRIGMLDRKLRVVGENTYSRDEWLRWARKAYQSTYGYEYQGDNLLFARINMVQTFIDYYRKRFGEDPDAGDVFRIAVIVSWNIWQMDGLTDTTPCGIPEDDYKQLSLFDEPEEPAGPVYCLIMDWEARQAIEFRSMKQ